MSQAQKNRTKSQHEITCNTAPETTEKAGKDSQTRDGLVGVKRTRLTLGSCSSDSEAASTNPGTTVFTTTVNPGISGSASFEGSALSLSGALDSSTTEPSKKKAKLLNTGPPYVFGDDFSPEDKFNTLIMAWENLVDEADESEYEAILGVLNWIRHVAIKEPEPEPEPVRPKTNSNSSDEVTHNEHKK